MLKLYLVMLYWEWEITHMPSFFSCDLNETYERDLVKKEEFYHLKEVIFGMDSS